MVDTPKSSIERTIRFYRVQVGFTETGEPRPFDAAAIFDRISSLEWDPENPEGRYLDDGRGLVTCCSVHEKHSRRVWFAGVRRRDLPQLEHEGNLKALSVPEGAGLAERSHMVFFRNNLVGVEFNFYAPRINRLRQYLRAKVPDLAPEVSFEALLRNDAAQRLEQLDDIRKLTLRVRPSLVETIREANESLGKAFDVLMEGDRAQDVEIVLRMKPGGSGTLMQTLLGACRKLLTKGSFRDEATTFRVKGLSNGTRQVEEFDLLNDALFSKKMIVREGDESKAVDTTSAFLAIEEAFQEREQELLEAPSLSFALEP